MVKMAIVNTEAASWIFSTGFGAYLRTRGIECHCISSGGPELDRFVETEHVVAHPLDVSRTITPWRDFSTVWQLAATLRLMGARIVLGETSKSGLLAMVAGWLARTPVLVYRNHGMALCSARGMRRILLWWCEKISCLLADRVIYVAPSVRDAAVALRVCPPGKATVVLSANGLDTEGRFNPAVWGAGAREEVRRRYEIPSDALVLGYVGRLFWVKGTAQLARAWTTLADLYPSLHLLIAGEFDTRDPVSDSVKQQLKNAHRVHLAGYVKEVGPLLAAMDALILPSFHEGLGYTLLEASAMELPVIGTRIPGIVDAVHDGVTGTLIEPGSVEDIIQAVRAYLDDPERRRLHGQNGRRFVVKTFNQQRVWDELYAVLASTANAAGAPMAAPDTAWRHDVPDYSRITETPDTHASADQMQILHTRYGLAAEYATGREVLEVACGAGVGLGMLARVARRVVAGDIDERNCAIARETYRHNPKVEVRALDAEEMPFPSASFDLVILYEALYYLRSADAFFREAKRVLRPGGTLLIFSVNRRWSGFNPSPYSTKYYDAPEMVEALLRHGFSVAVYGGFPEHADGLIGKTTGAIRKAAISLHVIPRTQRSKEWLKRIFYGRLQQIPRELQAGAVAPAALDALTPPYAADRYRFICAVAANL